MTKETFDKKLLDILELAFQAVTEMGVTGEDIKKHHSFLNGDVTFYFSEDTWEASKKFAHVKYCGIEVNTNGTISIVYGKNDILPIKWGEWFDVVIEALTRSSVEHLKGRTLQSFLETTDPTEALKQAEWERDHNRDILEKLKVESVEYKVKADMLDNILGKDGVMFSNK